MGLACREEPAKMMKEERDNFLLFPDSIWKWFKYWKSINLPLPEYEKRRLIYVTIYVVRYCISIHRNNCSLGTKLIRLLEGKEFATFIIDEWVGDGLVGVMTTSDGTRSLIKEFRFANRDLARIYCDYFESGVATVRGSEFNCFANCFEESLGDMAPSIHKYGDFSEVCLLRQAAFYRQKYIINPYRAQKALRHIVGFYRYIINTEDGCGIFNEGNFSAGLIRNMNILRFLSEGWDFIHYHAIEPSETRQRLVVVIKDMNRTGTRYVNGDAIAFDLSLIKTPYYRNLVWRYIRSFHTVFFNHSNVPYIVESLHLLESAKGKTGIKLTSFANVESSLVRAHVLEKQIQDQTVVYVFGVLRRFFEWTDKQRYIIAESEIALKSLRYHPESIPVPTMKKAIPRQDFDLLIKYLKKEGEHSFRAKLIYTIINILAVTRFRPSQTCIMDVQSIHLDYYGEFCFIRGVTKVSRGDKTWSLATAKIYHDLEILINSSADLRDRCFDPSIHDKVFLYESANGFDFVREIDVKQAMEQACNALGLPHWTPYSIRKMHATVWDELDHKLGYQGELVSQAMGHKSYDMTRLHYIDKSFKEFRRVEGANLISTDEMMRREFEELTKNGRI